jgi:hypothetical protein
MAMILGIDLGKLESVACTYDPATQEAPTPPSLSTPTPSGVRHPERSEEDEQTNERRAASEE